MYKCSKFSESEINSLPSDVLERYEKLKEMSEDFADDKEMYEVLQKNDNALAEIIKKHISNHKSSSSTATQEAEEAEEEVAETESKPQKTRVKKEPKPKVKKEPKQKAERKPKVKKEPKQKAERKPKVKKVKKVKPKAEKKIKKPESKAEPKNQVDSIPKSIAVLRSYLTLNGKEVTAKRLFSTYAGAAKAINDGLIRKTDKYADQIRAMLKNIRKHYAGLKKGDDITKFSIPNVEALKKTVSKYMVKPDMAAVKSFLNFYSKKQKTPKETANRLLTRIKKLPKSKVMGQAARSVEQFLDNGQWGYLLPSELKGLAGLAGISFDGLKKKIDKSTMQPSPISGIDPAQTETSTVPITGDGSINTTDLNKVIFETFDLPGQFKTFIGKASSPFHMMIYGEKGSGKSSLAIQLAKALAIGLNMKVTVFDNASSYPPLLEYYRNLPKDVTLVNVGYNSGVWGFWQAKLNTEERTATHYITTDSDCPPDEVCPKDLVEKMVAVLDALPTCTKVSPGIRIDNIPEHYDRKKEAIACQVDCAKIGEVIELPRLPRMHKAITDTTMTLWRGGERCEGRISTSDSRVEQYRLDHPYVLRHVPWYANSSSPTAESLYYRNLRDKVNGPVFGM